MLDNRIISNKHNNPNNNRSKDDLKKRSLDIYEDDTFFDLVDTVNLFITLRNLWALKMKLTHFP